MRLLQQERFIIPSGHAEAVLSMQFGDDVVEHFARLEIERDPSNERGITTLDLRQRLRDYVDERNIRTDGWSDLTHMRKLSDRLRSFTARSAARTGATPSTGTSASKAATD